MRRGSNTNHKQTSRSFLLEASQTQTSRSIRRESNTNQPQHILLGVSQAQTSHSIRHESNTNQPQHLAFCYRLSRPSHQQKQSEPELPRTNVVICVLGDRRVGGTRLVRLRMGDLDLNREWGKKLLFARMNGLRSKVLESSTYIPLQRISYRKVNGGFLGSSSSIVSM